MKWYILVGLILIGSCGQTSGLPSTKAGKFLSDADQENGLIKAQISDNKEHIDDSSDNQVSRVVFGGDSWIDYVVKNGSATIKNHVDTFKISAVVDISANESIPNKDSFRGYCSNQFQSGGNEIDLTGEVNLFLNPLDKEVARRLIGKKHNLGIYRVTNPFVVKNLEVAIIAPNLTKREEQLVAMSGILEKMSLMSRVQIGFFSFTSYFENNPSRAFARLLCDIANGQALLRYKLSDQNNKIVWIEVNDIAFNNQYF